MKRIGFAMSRRSLYIGRAIMTFVVLFHIGGYFASNHSLFSVFSLCISVPTAILWFFFKSTK